MKYISAFLVACVLATAPGFAAAQEEEKGFSLVEKGAQLFFKGLLQELEPALDDMQDLADGMEPALRNFAQQVGPALGDILKEVEDWSVYEAPEILPNGDIIMRRKAPEKASPKTVEPLGEVEL